MKPLSLCIAWHGLPFYAYESLKVLERSGVFDLRILGSEAKGCIKGNPSAADLAVQWVNAGRVESFRSLDVAVPDIFLKTSWHHPLFEALAREVKVRGGKVVALVDNIFIPRPRKIAGILAGRLFISRRNDAVWVPGTCAARYMRMMGFTPNRIFQGLYSTSEHLFSPAAGERFPRAIFVGRFEREKNIHALVKAWGEYKKRGGRLKELVLIGSGSIRIESSPEVGLCVRDWASQSEVARLMAESECFVLPSLCDHWGVVLLEAALSGAVLISNRMCGAAHDLIEQGRNGIMAEGVSAEHLSSAFLRYDSDFSSTSLRASAGARSRELALGFTAGRFANTAERIAELVYE